MKIPYPTFLLLLTFFGLNQLLGQKVDMSLFHGMQPRNIGPAGMSGRVTAIDVVLSDPDAIYIGAAAGGVWKSENSGHTWTPIFDQEKAASIGAIAIYQKNPNIIYVGTGEGNPRNSHNSGYGMFKSIDGGRTWEHLELEKTRQIHRVIIDPNNPDVVVIGVEGSAWADSRERGIFKTTDGGKTWEKTLYVDQRTGCSDLVSDPSNPNKLIAGMWDHRRDPWFMQSGGPGSGIYLSNDGGHHWEKITTENGLPEGDLGRIGLSFAPSKPSVVYAYIESKSNGIFRSDDGGLNWQRASKPNTPNIGDRPFYYADIYVDSKNENRIYSIATNVNESEDGGKTWSVFASGEKIHADHHAWWAHPEDPDFLIVGNDGGLNITHDRGKNWWFADNLPLAQFYHVRVDNEIPYNIYGGLQDNGSWKGPSQVFFKGGIRNFYWQRLSYGDGFDVVPDPLDHNFGYSMGQSGNLLRYDCRSGQLLKIKPLHPDGEYLRFNWNTGIAIDPIDNKTIYYGSQYLHKSSDHGQSWSIISPDLTTNDPSKQLALESGGLTFDATGAENHTTIITIAPSALDEKIIWVGTDDGNVQLTRDGGSSWTNCTPRFSDVPAGTWIPQIQASKFKEGEAFVVFDDHRRNNWEAFLFRTRDFGRTWERIADDSDVFGFVYCFEQDPVEPKLYFCGTEFGLYVSFDEGKHWNKWTNGYPTVPTRDMIIHPRDHDLVIGTFGRAFWILDDIRPLQALAQNGVEKTMDNDLEIFPVPDAYLNIIGESIGYREGKVGDAYFNGTNRAYGALISYYLKNAPENDGKLSLEDQVKIEITDASGKPIRTIYQNPKKGVNRIAWDLERDAPRNPNVAKPQKMTAARGGMAVIPGKYTAHISYQKFNDQIDFSVLPDIRLKVEAYEWLGKNKMIEDFYADINQLTAAMDEVRELENSLKFLKEKLMQKDEALFNNSWKDKINTIEKDLKTQKEKVIPKEVQGIYRQPAVLLNQLFNISSYLDHTLSPPTDNQRLALQLFRKDVADFLKEFEEFKNGELAGFKKEVGTLGVGILD